MMRWNLAAKMAPNAQVSNDQRQTIRPCDLRNVRPRSPNRLFHRDCRPGAGRASERPRLSCDQARRSRGPARKGRERALRASRVPGRAGDRVRGYPPRCRSRRRALPDPQRSQPRHRKDATFEDPKGTVCEVFASRRRSPRSSRSQASGRSSSAIWRSSCRSRRRSRISTAACSVSASRTGSGTGSCSCAAGRTITP